jgi:hypothetical protein
MAAAWTEQKPRRPKKKIPEEKANVEEERGCGQYDVLRGLSALVAFGAGWCARSGWRRRASTDGGSHRDDTRAGPRAERKRQVPGNVQTVTEKVIGELCRTNLNSLLEQSVGRSASAIFRATRFSPT